MSTTAVTAGQIMDRVANMLNDPNKTDYTYAVQMPYLNMAIEEFSDHLSESNSPFANMTSTNFIPFTMILPVGQNSIGPPEDPNLPVTQRFPMDLIEIQEVGEREWRPGVNAPNLEPFRALPRREFGQLYPRTNSLLYWIWDRGYIRFNINGATIPMEIEIKFLYQGIPYVTGPDTVINMIGARTYLGYKTAAFCAFFIGENETRAAILEDKANEALDRTLNISNKGKQEIMTRHRPFRASYKARGWF